MRILITGGAGFVGANLAVFLRAEGHDVTVMDNLVRRGSEHNLGRLAASGAVFRHGDIRCPEDWVGLKADAVLECAAQPSVIDGYGNPLFDFTNNTVGALRALEFCRAQGAAIIMWSTNKTYPRQHVDNRTIWEEKDRFRSLSLIGEDTPLDGGDRSLYGASKIMADLMIQEWADAFQMPAIINRFSCLAGPWQWGKCEQGWVAWWVIAHRLGLPLQYIGFDGKQVRDVLFMPDLCRLIRLELAGLKPGAQVFNVGGGPDNSMSLRECTGLVQEITGCKVPISSVGQERRADFRWYVSNLDKVQWAMRWAPQTSLRDGLEEIDRWACEHIDLLNKMYA